MKSLDAKVTQNKKVLDWNLLALSSVSSTQREEQGKVRIQLLKEMLHTPQLHPPVH